jgi:hypothetical protein
LGTPETVAQAIEIVKYVRNDVAWAEKKLDSFITNDIQAIWAKIEKGEEVLEKVVPHGEDENII